MTTQIHPTALVSPSARLAEGVEIGPYCVIGPHVTIGARTKLGPHVVVDGVTTLGEDNTIAGGNESIAWTNNTGGDVQAYLVLDCYAAACNAFELSLDIR